MVIDSKERSPAISESAVVIQITLNDSPFFAMLDSDAQPSIVDKVTLLSLGVDLPVCPGRVHGVAESVVRTLGNARLMVHMGQKYGVSNKFLVLDTNEPTVIWRETSYHYFVQQSLIGQIIGFALTNTGYLLRLRYMEGRFYRACRL